MEQHDGQNRYQNLKKYIKGKIEVFANKINLDLMVK